MNKLTSILTAFLLLLGSCQADEWKEEGTHLSDREGFTLSYSISAPISAVTKASVPTEEGEDKVNSFYILFFENVVGGNGTFVEAIDALGAYEASLGSSGKLEIIFPDDSNLKGAAEYKMILLANIENYLTNINSVEDLNFYLEGMKEREAANMLFCIKGVEPGEGEETDNSNRIPSANLPMSASAVKKAKEAEVSIELFRAVSRFDVFSTADGYELVSASIWNAHTETTWIPSDSFEYTNSRTGRFYGVNATNGEITGTLYAFENRSESPSQKDKETTCLIIGLKKAGENTVEYFRVNIHGAAQPQDLKRNNVYRTTIAHVKNGGDRTEQEAYENENALLEIDINGWTFDETSNVLHDGENILAFPTKVINFCATAETREYYVFTRGTETLQIAEENLPSGMTAQLLGNLLIVKAEASDEVKQGYITLKLGTLSGSIAINQHPHETDFLELSVETLPVFPAEGLHDSQDIIVTSSGAWEAEIYNGIWFSYSSSPIQVTKTEGQPGESFNIYSIRENTDPEVRYSFAVVRLKDTPEVSRVLTLEQEAVKFLYFTPEFVAEVPAEGGSSELISIHSNASWTAVLTIEQGDAGLNGNVQTKTISGTGNKTFTVTFPELTERNIYPKAVVTVAIDGTNTEESIYVYQTPTSDSGILVWTNTLGVSTITRSDQDPISKASDNNTTNQRNHYRFVYNWGENMRNKSLFGPEGIIYMPLPYIFRQGGSFTDAKIFQLVSKPTTEAEVLNIKAVMDADPNTLIIMSHTDAAVRNTLTEWGETLFGSSYNAKNYITGASVGASKTAQRYLNPDLDMSNPVFAYLLNGPFSQNGPIDPESVWMYGPNASSTNQGLSKWPETFIPIIMSLKSKTPYCVFGIDPTHRLIWIGDPGIFGSNEVGSGNNAYLNFQADRPENIAFLNNFIAWMTRAVTEDGFLDNFR